MLAIQIQKNAQNGQNKNFSIRLDPPDLGRVNVEMQFNEKGRALKTILTIERPETHAMLQRDAHMLEKTLENMGLDTDAGISFELASDSHDFMGHNERGGGHDQGGSGASDVSRESSEDIIETSLMWMIDPETGHTSYDFWA